MLHSSTCRCSRRHQGSRTSLPPGAAAVTAAAVSRFARCCHQGCRPLLQPSLLLLPVAATIDATMGAAAIDGARCCGRRCYYRPSLEPLLSSSRQPPSLSRLPLPIAATVGRSYRHFCCHRPTVSCPLWLSLLHHDKEINNQPICGFICLFQRN